MSFLFLWSKKKNVEKSKSSSENTKNNHVVLICYCKERKVLKEKVENKKSREEMRGSDKEKCKLVSWCSRLKMESGGNAVVRMEVIGIQKYLQM